MSQRIADLSKLLPTPTAFAGLVPGAGIGSTSQKSVSEIPKVKESAYYLSPSAAAVSEMIESESCEPVTAPIRIFP